MIGLIPNVGNWLVLPFLWSVLCAYMLYSIRGITSLMSNITGLPEWGCILIAWASYTFFTIFAGSPGVLVTDTMMFFVFLVAAIIAIPCITINAGGWTAVHRLATSTESPVFYLGAVMPIMLHPAVRPRCGLSFTGLCGCSLLWLAPGKPAVI